jgi:hypothetical protein
LLLHIWIPRTNALLLRPHRLQGICICSCSASFWRRVAAHVGAQVFAMAPAVVLAARRFIW